MVFTIKCIGGIRDEHIVHACVWVGIDLIGYQACQDGGRNGYRIPVITGVIGCCTYVCAIVFHHGGGLQGPAGELYLADGLSRGEKSKEAGDACEGDAGWSSCYC